MTSNLKAWMAWKGITHPSSAQRAKEAIAMVAYYEENKPVPMISKAKYR